MNDFKMHFDKELGQISPHRNKEELKQKLQ